MRRRVLMSAAVVALVAVAVVVAVFGSGGEPEETTMPVLQGGSAYGAPAADPPPREVSGSSVEGRPTKGSAAAARQAARLLLVGFGGTSAEEAGARIARKGFGGVVLEQGNVAGEAQVRELVAGLRAAAGRPLLVAARQDGSEATTLPGLPPREPALTPGPEAAAADAAAAARALRGLGIGMTLAPPASLGSAGGPWEGLAFGDGPSAVRAAVEAAVRAYRKGGVAPVVGRFPGEGAASQDPEAGAASVGLSLEDLRAADIAPFAAVAKRAPAIQMSSALYAAFDGVTPATLLPEAVEELRSTGFRGAIVSADLAATTLATGGDVGEAAVAALAAGCDLLWVPGDAAAQDEAVRELTRAIRAGEVPERRVRDALRRIGELRRAQRAG